MKKSKLFLLPLVLISTSAVAADMVAKEKMATTSTQKAPMEKKESMLQKVEDKAIAVKDAVKEKIMPHKQQDSMKKEESSAQKDQMVSEKKEEKKPSIFKRIKNKIKRNGKEQDMQSVDASKTGVSESTAVKK